MALNEPLLDRKVIVNAAINSDAVRPAIRRSAAAPALRWVVEQCLRQRQLEVCLIDEAQHLKRLASGRQTRPRHTGRVARRPARDLVAMEVGRT